MLHGTVTSFLAVNQHARLPRTSSAEAGSVARPAVTHQRRQLLSLCEPEARGRDRVTETVEPRVAALCCPSSLQAAPASLWGDTFKEKFTSVVTSWHQALLQPGNDRWASDLWVTEAAWVGCRYPELCLRQDTIDKGPAGSLLPRVVGKGYRENCDGANT